jgi:hypothetical protein
MDIFLPKGSIWGSFDFGWLAKKSIISEDYSVRRFNQLSR